MTRNDLWGWVDQRATAAHDGVYGQITTIYNSLVDWRNWVASLRSVAHWHVDNAFQWVPWPLSEARDWLFGLIRNSVVDPAFDRVLNVADIPIAALDALWMELASDWIPAVHARDIVLRLGEVVMSVWDSIADADGAVRAWITDGWSRITAWVIQVRDALQGSIDGVSAYLTTAIADTLAGLGSRISLTDSALAGFMAEMQGLRDDPGGYVWDRLQGSLTERVRTFLLGRW